MKNIARPSEQPLTVAEQRWLAAFRRMSPSCANTNLVCMEGMARRFPRHRQPVLHLVSGGAK